MPSTTQLSSAATEAAADKLYHFCRLCLGGKEHGIVPRWLGLRKGRYANLRKKDGTLNQQHFC